MIRRKLGTLLFLTCGLLFWIGCRETASPRVSIATSANMQYVMKELVDDFAYKTGQQCDLIIGSTGKLTAQIAEGAPYDLLIAANMMYPEYLHARGLSLEEPKIYAYGKLVLWTVLDDVDPDISLLNTDAVKKIALANPKTAPYGEAAIQVLKYHGLLDSVKDKLVYGESVAQTNQFITTGAASLGFTALSVVKSDLMRNTGRWALLPEDQYELLAQGVLLIDGQDREIHPAAENFYEYLFSDDAVKILEEFGYSSYE